MVSSLGDVRSVPVVFILDWCFFHRLLSLGYCFVHPFSSKQPPSSQGPHDINHNTQQDEAKTDQDSFIFFFELDTLHSQSHRHRPLFVHVEEFSMAFQDRHETGVHGEHRTEWSSV